LFNLGRPKITDIDYLIQVLNSCWDMIGQEIINGSIDQWAKRLMLVILSHHGRVEHHFRLLCVVVLVANRISAVVCLEIVAGIDVLKVR